MTSKVAIVTGAGSGIGKATSLALAKAGWRVTLVGRRLQPLKEAADEAGEGAFPASCDISDAAQVASLFADLAAREGRVDLLFNNAGMSYKSMLIDDIPVDVWSDVVSVNLTGSFLCARAAFGAMRRQDPIGGRIINNGSISAYAPRPGSVPYTATKHAITGLTRTLALDGRPFNIACGQIDIGNALTEMALPMTMGVPQANGDMAVEATMDVNLVAQAVVQMAALPLEANVLFQTIMATQMPYVGRG